MVHYGPGARPRRFRYDWRPHPPTHRMQLLFDFLPVIAFFVAYKLADIYVATGVIIVACVLQITVYWLWKRRVNPMHLVSAGLVLVFGGLTLLIHDKSFIMWKPTILNWLFAAAFLGSMWRRISDRPLIQRMLGGRPHQVSGISGDGSTDGSIRKVLIVCVTMYSRACSSNQFPNTFSILSLSAVISAAKNSTG